MSTISVRLDAESKAQFTEICRQLGLSTTSAFVMFAKSVVRNKSLPFDLSQTKTLAERVKEMPKCAARELLEDETPEEAEFWEREYLESVGANG